MTENKTTFRYKFKVSWCNGSTADFDPVGLGSIPRETAKYIYEGMT